MASNNPAPVHNDLSGTVNGPVFQAGTIGEVQVVAPPRTPAVLAFLQAALDALPGIDEDLYALDRTRLSAANRALKKAYVAVQHEAPPEHTALARRIAADCDELLKLAHRYGPVIDAWQALDSACQDPAAEDARHARTALTEALAAVGRGEAGQLALAAADRALRACPAVTPDKVSLLLGDLAGGEPRDQPVRQQWRLRARLDQGLQEFSALTARAGGS